MSTAFPVNIQDRPDTNTLPADEKRHLSGIPNAPLMKCHPNTVTNRIAFLMEGAITWMEKDAEPKVHGVGTLSYVETGTIYGGDLLEDSKILTAFDCAPGINTY